MAAYMSGRTPVIVVFLLLAWHGVVPPAAAAAHGGGHSAKHERTRADNTKAAAPAGNAHDAVTVIPAALDTDDEYEDAVHADDEYEDKADVACKNTALVRHLESGLNFSDHIGEFLLQHTHRISEPGCIMFPEKDCTCHNGTVPYQMTNRRYARAPHGLQLLRRNAIYLRCDQVPQNKQVNFDYFLMTLRTLRALNAKKGSGYSSLDGFHAASALRSTRRVMRKPVLACFQHRFMTVNMIFTLVAYTPRIQINVDTYCVYTGFPLILSCDTGIIPWNTVHLPRTLPPLEITGN